MSKRPLLGLSCTLDLLRDQGVDIESALGKRGLRILDLDPSANIEISEELSILCELADLLDDEYAGIKMGANFRLSGYAAFGMLLISCSNAYEAIQTGIRYQKLTYLYGTIDLHLSDKDCSLCYHPNYLPESIDRFIIDRDTSGTYRLIEELSTLANVKMPVKELWLPYKEPEDARAIEARYPFPVKYGQSEVRFVLDSTQMKVPFTSASSSAYSLYKEHCDQALNTLNASEDTIAESIRTHLQLFQNNYPNGAQVADTLGISERSLRRKLKEENTSFQKLLDESKFTKAKRFLSKSNDSIEAISYRLGYNDAGSFIRAFQRWTGQTPAQYRKSANATRGE